MKTPAQLNIKNHTVIHPENGWEQDCVYLVEVAYSSTNIIHKAILQVSFSLAHPNSWIMSTGYEQSVNPSKVYYLKAIKKLINLD